MIGIEMCRIMQKKSDIKVAGLVLIDTPNSQRWSLLGPEVIRYEPGIKSTSPWVRKCVEQRFKFADDLVDTWLFPSMADLTADSQLSLDDMGVQAFPIPKVKQSDSTTASDTARMTSLCTNQEFMNNMKLQYERGLLPPTMLLRAVEFAQDAIENTELRNRIDCDRDFPLLGWEQCPVKFISVVQDTAGNHYTMFDGDEKVARSRSHFFRLMQKSNSIIYSQWHSPVQSLHGVCCWMAQRIHDPPKGKQKLKSLRPRSTSST